MVQVSESVGTAQNGSTKALAGSGMASMSLASMLFHPRMEEPSKPKPSSNTSSVNSAMGTLKCCQVPKVSTNLMSIIFAPCFLALSITFFGVLIVLWRVDLVSADATNALQLPLAKGNSLVTKPLTRPFHRSGSEQHSRCSKQKLCRRRFCLFLPL